MVNTNTLKTNNGKKIYLYRGNTENADLSSTQYLPETQFRVGISDNNISTTTTSLTKIIPITAGTANDDGSNTLTGSSGGDNSTDNTTTYKTGAGTSDTTAQNLISNTTNVTKKWTISDLSSEGSGVTSTDYAGLWLYIKDQTTLDYFADSGNCLKIIIGTDASNYYYFEWTKSQLSLLWNFVSNFNTVVENWDSVGTPTSLVYFSIEITTNNVTDSWGSGDVIYDILQSWSDSDTKKDFETGYPIIDYTNLEVTKRLRLNSTESVGFPITHIAILNEDTTPLTGGLSSFSSQSKSSTDEFIFIEKERLI